jgi:hypothetical protein
MAVGDPWLCISVFGHGDLVMQPPAIALRGNERVLLSIEGPCVWREDRRTAHLPQRGWHGVVPQIRRPNAHN